MKKWLEDFKLALIQEDVNTLESLLDDLNLKDFAINTAQKSNNDEELRENINDALVQIQALLQEALKLIAAKKDNKANEIRKFQKALKYFNS
ncbi:hypothetical protein [Campylobacter estrildidarum]|uniref:Uncharacterized protein n=1 Tax=Campylobacter estrildidarum TaxID=2510189 RepID=A0A4U7BKJ0_9BACT|nr:hypothetical protein [Campylobacter estrildidarum]TKX32119.1 hypothetical protein CQA69_01005 [Campylobacter estrildidarum]